MKTISYSAVIMRLLVEKRELKGLEQSDIAHHLGVTPSSYSRLETGQTGLTVDTMFRIANILDVDVTEIIEEGQKVISKAANDPNVNVAPLSRSNTKGATPGMQDFVTGAALGAIITALLRG